MKKITVFLIFCFILALLISCNEQPSNTTAHTANTTTAMPNTTASPTPTVSTTQPITTQTPITSTAVPTETQPPSTSDVPKTDPTVIRVGFWLPKGPITCPLYIAYEIPKSCSLSDETIPISLYFALDEVLVLNDASEEDYFEIYLWDNQNLVYYPLRNMTIKEARSKNYIRPDSGPLFSSHSETFEIPLSLFSEEKSNTWDVRVDYYREDNTWYGCNSLFIDYEKINGETIVFNSGRPYPNAKS